MNRYDTFLNWLIKLRLLVLVAVAVGLYLLESDEHDATGFDILAVSEFYIYFLILPVLGFLFEMLARTNRKLNGALKILDQKHRLSASLALESDWESLINRLAQVPRMISGVQESILLLNNQTSNCYDPVAQWSADEENRALSAAVDPGGICPEEFSGIFHRLEPEDLQSKNSGENVYCLHITYGETPVGLLRLRTAPGRKPPSDQIEMIKNLVSDMAASLITGVERKNLADLQAADAARMERRTMSRYLHDHVSQNLGYVRLKLDQFSSSLPPPQLDDLKKDFSQMRDAVNESYEIVRSSLEAMHGSVGPRLVELVQEHTVKVANRASLEISVSQEGETTDLPVQNTRLIFFIIREALSNIEKHAGASKAQVRLEWGPEKLNVTIADNGKGFNLQEVDSEKHFGLGIMQERAAELDGQIDIKSSVETGTTVAVCIPIKREGITQWNFKMLNQP